jgi:group I intron endonuclease
MLNTTLNLLLKKVLDYNFGQGPKLSNTELSKIKVLEPLVYNYLLNLYPKINKVSSRIISKLIICNIFKDDPQDSLKWIKNNSFVQTVLTDNGWTQEFLVSIHPLFSNDTQYHSFTFKSIPVKVYHNCEVNAQLILDETKDKPGIYLWLNTINGKMYVGSAKDLSKRLRNYWTMSTLMDSNNLITRAILKYGHLKFDLAILEILESSDNLNNQLLDKEQYYIILYNTMMPHGYNMRPADRTLEFNHSEDTKKLISSIQSGRVLSLETKAKISAKMKGRIITDTHKAKMSLSKQGYKPIKAYEARRKLVWVYDLNKNPVLNNPFKSVSQCITEMNINRNAIYKWMDTNEPINGYYYYSYPAF